MFSYATIFNAPYENSPNTVIIVTQTEFGGMVGETHLSFTVQVGTLTSEGLKIENTFNDLDNAWNYMKMAYKSVQGRRERIDFWHTMKAISPKGREEQSQRERDEAIARVI